MPDRKRLPVLFLVKAFYFLFYAAQASVFPFITLYYQSLGLSGREIGFLSGLQPLVMFLSAPLWSGLADATGQHKRVLLGTMLGVIVAVLGLARANTLAMLTVTVGLYAFCMAPVAAIVDHSVLRLLGAKRDQYGRQRLWGAFGYALMAPLLGAMAGRYGLGSLFYGFGAMMGMTWLVALAMPVQGEERPRPDATGQTANGRPRRWGSGPLLADKRWIVFIVVVLVISLGRSANTFVSLHLQSLGASRAFIGTAASVAAVVEMPFFFFSDRLLRRWGARGTLILCVLGSTLDLLIYSMIRAPWAVLPTRVLHGSSFAMLTVASVAYADELAPKGWGATYQGIRAAVGGGLGVALGGLLAGQLYDHMGAPPTFRIGAAMLTVALGLLVWNGGRPKREPVLSSKASL
jgi:PPP family 3-phenylpropionic acid transporter